MMEEEPFAAAVILNELFTVALLDGEQISTPTVEALQPVPGPLPTVKLIFDW